MKICSRCKIEKEEILFTKNKTKKDGLNDWCKKCSSEYRKTDNGKKLQKISTKKYLLTEGGKVSRRKSKKKYVKKQLILNIVFRKKYLARRKLRKSIKLGRITRLPCEICGNIKSHAHHKDYSKPLDVIWLCQKHHQELHNNIK